MTEQELKDFVDGVADVVDVYARQLFEIEHTERRHVLSAVLGGLIHRAAGPDMDQVTVHALYDAVAGRVFERVEELDRLAGRPIVGHA